MPLATFLVELLLADSPDVRRVIIRFNRGMACWVIVPLVQTQVLRILCHRFRSVRHNRLDGLLQKFGVMHVGPGDHHPQRSAIGIDD
jgi:hypothetical protein